ncbi:putative Smr domain-containing protein [Helianthus annuus]|nr:putative Smr domain-containing protein [Helianthus annuus]KAJ0902181.1 putative Smr domain-containing protein [Helianthus annuus]
MKQSKKKKRPRPGPKPHVSKPNQSTGSQNPNSDPIDDPGHDQIRVLNSLTQNPNSDPIDDPGHDQVRILNSLTDSIASVSLNSTDTGSGSGSSVNREEDGIEMFGSLTETCSSSSGSSGLSNCDEYNRAGRGKVNKGSKVVAATGMVSSVLGKDYVFGKRGVSKLKGLSGDGGGVSYDDAEQFLCSMLGDDCELGMSLVKDVLCQTAYDVEKALDILLELTGSPSSELSDTGSHQNLNVESKDTRSPLKSSASLTDRTSDLASSSETDLNVGFDRRNYFDVLAGCGPQPPSGTKNTSELTHEVLESLFNAPKSSKHEPGSMNWRNVVKKMESLGQGLDYSPEDTVKKQHIPAKGDDYQDYRTTASQHWDSMKSYYHKAATAYANGKREYAAYLSDQGRICNEKARQADERASQDIFNSRNKDIENVITIDLHGQHVKQGMKLLKLHLLFGAYVRSVRLFRVITGCGSHGLGKSKIKQTVVNLLEAENIEWKEENRGTLLIKLNGQREFSFLDSGSDSD